jgi:type III pantothenate kinase
MSIGPIAESDPGILAVDAGNTRIKWGVNDGQAWVATGAVTSAIASNVAGPHVLGILQQLCVARGIALIVIRSEPTQLGVTNGYYDPAQLGSDRWASLIAAHSEQPAHQLVVNVGTALTVDALTASGHFLGGLIVPGPALMRRSLDRGTAGLRLTEGHFHELPRSTPDAITSGAIQACVGAILRMAGVMEKAKSPPHQVILSGGGAGEIAPHLPIPFAIRENLVLDGLATIARKR